MVVFEADLPLAGAFDDDLCLAAGFGVVSASCDAGEVSDCAIVGAVVSGSAVGSEVAPLCSSSWTWLFFLVDLVEDLPFAGVFEFDLRFTAGFEVVSTSGDASGIASDSTVG